MRTKFSIAVHGGAGTILASKITREQEMAYREGLQQALEAGYHKLYKSGTALEAVEAAIICLEDNTLFNAGKGSVLTHQGDHEMESSIMCGDTLQAGAISGTKHIKNPITLARLILDQEDMVYLSGSGAEEFAKTRELDFVENSYFFTPFRFDQWKEAQSSGNMYLDHHGKIGTVGAVAFDQKGNLAAGTSTGGLTNKKFGRLGDSSFIGCGTYANNQTCAVSCTGLGEFFIRAVAAFDISSSMANKSLNLKEACESVIMQKLVKMKGEGGVIAVDGQGNIEMVFNSAGMYRGMVTEKVDYQVSIYK